MFCLYHMPAMPMEARRRHRAPGTGANKWVLGAEPRSSEGAAKVLNCWPISPVPFLLRIIFVLCVLPACMWCVYHLWIGARTWHHEPWNWSYRLCCHIAAKNQTWSSARAINAHYAISSLFLPCILGELIFYYFKIGVMISALKNLRIPILYLFT